MYFAIILNPPHTCVRALFHCRLLAVPYPTILTMLCYCRYQWRLPDLYSCISSLSLSFVVLRDYCEIREVLHFSNRIHSSCTGTKFKNNVKFKFMHDCKFKIQNLNFKIRMNYNMYFLFFIVLGKLSRCSWSEAQQSSYEEPIVLPVSKIHQIDKVNLSPAEHDIVLIQSKTSQFQ